MDEHFRAIRTDMIEPNRRLSYSREEIESFSDLFSSDTRPEPIVVTFQGEHFKILDGEKRWRAAKRTGFTLIDAVIVDAP